MLVAGSVEVWEIVFFFLAMVTFFSDYWFNCDVFFFFF